MLFTTANLLKAVNFIHDVVTDVLSELVSCQKRRHTGMERRHTCMQSEVTSHLHAVRSDVSNSLGLTGHLHIAIYFSNCNTCIDVKKNCFKIILVLIILMKNEQILNIKCVSILAFTPHMQMLTVVQSAYAAVDSGAVQSAQLLAVLQCSLPCCWLWFLQSAQLLAVVQCRLPSCWRWCSAVCPAAGVGAVCQAAGCGAVQSAHAAAGYSAVQYAQLLAVVQYRLPSCCLAVVQCSPPSCWLWCSAVFPAAGVGAVCQAAGCGAVVCPCSFWL